MKAQPLILIVDDTSTGRVTLEALLAAENYELAFAASGQAALEQAQSLRPDLILLDVMMPGMDGYEVCRRLRADPLTREMPVLMVTALDDRYSRLQGLDAGADDFITKPVDRAELRARVRTITRLDRYRQMSAERSRYEQLVHNLPLGLLIADPEGRIQLANRAAFELVRQDPQGSLDGRAIFNFLPPAEQETVRKAYSDLFSGENENIQFETVLFRNDGKELPVQIHASCFEEDGQKLAQIIVENILERKERERQLLNALTTQEETLDETILAMAAALEGKDEETEGHTVRVCDLTMKMVEHFPFDRDFYKYIRWGAMLHDIGKLFVPDEILKKNGKLTEDEWTVMRQHPLLAKEKILDLIFPLKAATTIPLYHHERWDGSGYPFGIKGEEIPLEARIFSVVDVWDALLSSRVYKEPWTQKDAIDFIRTHSGTDFDPQVVEVFFQVIGVQP